MMYLYIFIGGGLGSLARFGVGKVSKSFFSTDFPIGTLISNLLATALLALLILMTVNGDSKNNWIQPLLMIGFCGGFSTFSTFGHETFDLMNNGNWFYAVLNVLISVLAAVFLIWLIRIRS